MVVSQNFGSLAPFGGSMWSTHCATIAQPSSSRRAQSWFSGRDKNHFEYLSHRASYPRSRDVPRLPSRLRSCSSFFSRSAASPASRWSAQYLSVVTLLQLGHAQKCAGFCAILSPPSPCRIRAFLHPAPPFIFVIVLAFFAGGGCVYPRHPSRLIISFSLSESSHIFALAFSAAAFSAAAFSDKRKPPPKTAFPAPL